MIDSSVFQPLCNSPVGFEIGQILPLVKRQNRLRPFAVSILLEVPGGLLEKVGIRRDFIPTDAVMLLIIYDEVIKAERGKIFFYVGQIYADQLFYIVGIRVVPKRFIDLFLCGAPVPRVKKKGQKLALFCLSAFLPASPLS